MIENQKQTLLIRADANSHLGRGHAMRCLALAQGWRQRGGQVVLATSSPSSDLLRLYQAHNVIVVPFAGSLGGYEDLSFTLRLSREVNASWVVLDGPQFDERFERKLKESGLSVLLLDDEARREHIYSDFVLNPRLDAVSRLYPKKEAYTQLLLGASFVPLRKEFLDTRPTEKTSFPQLERMLITLGGADPDNITYPILKSLKAVPFPLEVNVIAGPENRKWKSWTPLLKKLPHRIKIQRDVKNMSTWMQWAHVAISGGGVSAWELLYMGVPSLLVILANNQEPNVKGMAKEKAALDLGRADSYVSVRLYRALRALIRTPQRLGSLSERARALVDGQGVDRVMMFLHRETLRLRPVHSEDCRLIWKWRNDPRVRSVSFNTKPIRWQDHVRWFRGCLTEPNLFQFLAVDANEEPIGHVRLDCTTRQKATISLMVSPTKQGLGYGPQMVSLALQKLFQKCQVQSVHAYVKPDNKKSVHLFEKARFRRKGKNRVKGHEAVHYVLDKSK